MLTRYLLRQLAPWLAISLAGAALVFLTTQLVRVAPVFVGAGATPLELASGLALLLVPVLGWALTPAFAVAVFAVLGRMSADGELTAVDAAGISRLRLAFAPLLLAGLLAAVAAWIWLDAGPRSQARLRAMAGDLAGRAIAAQVRPGRFSQPLPGITVYANSGGGGEYRGVMVEDRRRKEHPLLLVARRAEVRYRQLPQHLALRLDDGRALVGDGALATPVVLGFEQLDVTVSLRGELGERLGFLPWLMAVPTARLIGPPASGYSPQEWGFALWRRIAGPCGFLALALAAIALALGGRWRRRGVAVAAAAGLFLVFHLLSRFGESLALAGVLEPPLAALGPALLVLAVAAVLALCRPRALRRRSGNGIVV